MSDEPASAAPPATRDSSEVSTQRRRRWPVTIVAVIVAGVAKASALRALLHYGSLAVIGPVTLILSVIATRPKRMAFGAALIVAAIVHPASVLVGLGVGVAAWVLLLTLFVAVGAILQARQPLHGSDTRAA